MESQRDRKRRLKELHEAGIVLAARCDAHGKSDADVRLVIKALREVLAERRVRKRQAKPAAG